MTNEEAISILKNAAFLSTKTKYQAIEEAVNTAIKALKAQDGTDVNGDTIYRQAAIEVVSRGCQEFRGIFARCEKNLNELPSVQPETCKGCKHLGKWENELEYGYPSPCTRCKRRASDHYER